MKPAESRLHDQNYSQTHSNSQKKHDCILEDLQVYMSGFLNAITLYRGCFQTSVSFFLHCSPSSGDNDLNKLEYTRPEYALQKVQLFCPNALREDFLKHQ